MRINCYTESLSATINLTLQYMKLTLQDSSKCHSAFARSQTILRSSQASDALQALNIDQKSTVSATLVAKKIKAILLSTVTRLAREHLHRIDA